MRTVWKYQLGWTGLHELSLPAGAEILSVQLQDDTPTIWALVHTDATHITRRFLVTGTGWDIDREVSHRPLRHVGTWQDNGFVWHLFEVLEAA